jgi:hypothetical protein
MLPLSRQDPDGSLALVSRPAPSIVLQFCGDVSDTITALFSGGVGRRRKHLMLSDPNMRRSLKMPERRSNHEDSFADVGSVPCWKRIDGQDGNNYVGVK